MKIAEDNQFTPTTEAVSSILDLYGFELESYQEASSGIENRTLIVTTPNDKFVLRIYRQHKKHIADIRLELDFIEHLRTHSIKVPRIIANTQGETITQQTIGGRSWNGILMEFIEGHHADTYTDALLAELSEIQAKMHILSDAYSDRSATADSLNYLKENYFIAQIPKEALASDRLRAFLERAAAYEVRLPSELPHGLCHLDYDTDNTLVKDDSVAAVLDFDDLAHAPFVVCLGYTLWHVYTHAGEKASQNYLAHYETLRKLSDLERQYIKPIMLFRHYVISAIRVLNGHTLPEEIENSIRQETQLLLL